ncbi:hypothetical protein EDD22DRAFT_844640 [Suillus occidentalis]|nr:hypothetical protein EDD22DRAFT_844640 [Suillus occidentalis]
MMDSFKACCIFSLTFFTWQPCPTLNTISKENGKYVSTWWISLRLLIYSTAFTGLNRFGHNLRIVACCIFHQYRACRGVPFQAAACVVMGPGNQYWVGPELDASDQRILSKQSLYIRHLQNNWREGGPTIAVHPRVTCSASV